MKNLLILAVFMLAPSVGAETIYRCLDDKGGTVYSNPPLVVCSKDRHRERVEFPSFKRYNKAEDSYTCIKNDEMVPLRICAADAAIQKTRPAFNDESWQTSYDLTVARELETAREAADKRDSKWEQ